MAGLQGRRFGRGRAAVLVVLVAWCLLAPFAPTRAGDPQPSPSPVPTGALEKPSPSPVPTSALETPSLSPVRKGVLVMPFQDAPGPSEGFVAHAILEEMLAVDGRLDETRITWLAPLLFPTPDALQAWLAGKSDLSASTARIDLRYVLTGRVGHAPGGTVVLATLLDRSSGHRAAAMLRLDPPRFTRLRHGLLGLLKQAGLEPAPARKASMLWGEDLPAEAILPLAASLHDDLVQACRAGSPSQAGARRSSSTLQASRRVLSLAPRSYIATVHQASLLAAHQDWHAATRAHELALRLNPAGIAAVDGLLVIAARQGDAAAALRWTSVKARIQGRPEAPCRASTWDYLGDLAARREDHARAIACLEKALSLRTGPDQAEARAITLHNLGSAHLNLSRYERALQYFEASKTIRLKRNDRTGQAFALHDIGLTLDKMGRYEKALDVYSQALALRRALGDRPGEAATLDAMGVVHGHLSQYEKAIASFEAALAIARTRGLRSEEARALLGLGSSYGSLGRHDHAVPFYEKALAILHESGDQIGEGLARTSLGLEHHLAGRHERAIQCYAESLAIRRRIGDRAGQGTTLDLMGACRFELGQREAGLALLRQSLEVARAVKNRQGEATGLSWLGWAALRSSQPAEAVRRYREAVVVCREIGDRSGEADALAGLMYAFRALGRARPGIFHGKLAVNTWQAIRARIRGLDRESQTSFIRDREAAYRALAELLIDEGRLPEAQEVIDLLKEEELLHCVRGDRSQCSTAALTLTPLEKGLDTRMREMSSQVVALGAQYGQLLKKLQAGTITPAEKSRLDALEQQLGTAAQAFQKHLEQLSAELGNQQKSGEKLAHLKSAESLQTTLGDLGEGVVALYTLVEEGGLRVILVTPHAWRTYHLAIPKKELYRRVARFRSVLASPQKDPVPVAREMYRMIVGPELERDLKSAGARVLMWSLDDVLRYVPMAALHDGEGYLVEKYRLALLTVATRDHLQKVPSPSWNAAGLGVTQAHPGFVALPEVAGELRDIVREGAEGKGVLPGIIRLDRAFTLEALRDVLRQRYRVVHIASHFKFSPGDLTESNLLLGDGTYTNLVSLGTARFDGIELLTLSACSTGLGGSGETGKEVESFAALAQKKGAQAVLATLWPVADTSTRMLMRDLYHRRATQPGLSKAEALQGAQTALLRSKDYRHPCFWAPFILLGNWR